MLPNALPILGLALAPSSGTPSTTNNGLLLARMEELPLILMVEAAPGCPLVLVTSKPATLFCNNWSGALITPWLKFFD